MSSSRKPKKPSKAAKKQTVSEKLTSMVSHGKQASGVDVRSIGYEIIRENEPDLTKRYLQLLLNNCRNNKKANLILYILTYLEDRKDANKQTETLLSLLLENEANIPLLVDIFVAFAKHLKNTNSSAVYDILDNPQPSNKSLFFGLLEPGKNPPILDLVSYAAKRALDNNCAHLFKLLNHNLVPKRFLERVVGVKPELFNHIANISDQKTKLEALLNACDPKHALHQFFATQNGFLPTRASAGTRKKVFDEIYSMLKDEKNRSAIKEVLKEKHKDMLAPMFKQHPDAEALFLVIVKNISLEEAKKQINERRVRKESRVSTSTMSSLLSVAPMPATAAALAASGVRTSVATTAPAKRSTAPYPPQAQSDDGPPTYEQAQAAATPGAPLPKVAAPENAQQTGELVEALQSMSRSLLTRTVFTPHTFLIAVHAEAIPQSLAFGLLENKRFRNELKQYLKEIDEKKRFEHATISLARSFPLRRVEGQSLFNAVNEKITALDAKETAKTAPYQPSNSILARADQIADKLGKATKEAKRLTSKAITASKPASDLFGLLIREQIAASTINFRFRNDDAFAEMFTQHVVTHYNDTDVQEALQWSESALNSVIRNNETLRAELQKAEQARKQQAAGAVTPGAPAPDAPAPAPVPAQEYAQIGSIQLNVTQLRERAKAQPHVYVLGIALGVLKQEDITEHDLIRLKSVIDTNPRARQKLIQELGVLNGTAAQRVVENVEPKADSAGERTRLNHLLFANDDVHAAYQALAQRVRVAQATQPAEVQAPAQAESTPDQMYPSECFDADQPAVAAPVPSAPPVDAAPPEYNSEQMHADAARAKEYAEQAANEAEVAPSVSVAQAAKPSDIAEYIQRAEKAAELAKSFAAKGNAEKAAAAAKVAAAATGRVLSAREHTDADLNHVQATNVKAQRAVATAKANAAAAETAKQREEQQRAQQAAIAADAERLRMQEEHLRLAALEREVLQQRSSAPAASSAPAEQQQHAVEPAAVSFPAVPTTTLPAGRVSQVGIHASNNQSHSDAAASTTKQGKVAVAQTS